MNAGSSFLDFACARVALIPSGPALSDQRFEELASHLTNIREIPTSSLPCRKTKLPRSSTTAFSASLPASKMESLIGPSESSLPRSRSTTRDLLRSTKLQTLLLSKHASSKSVSSAGESLPAAHTHTTDHIPNTGAPNLLQAPDDGISTLVDDGDSFISNIAPSSKALTNSVEIDGDSIEFFSQSIKSPSISTELVPELDLECAEVDSCFRLSYDILYRDHSGSLLLKPPSEWDAFHSRKLWAVFSIADATGCESGEEREALINEARQEFLSTLEHFKETAVRRLFVFVPPNDEKERSFVEQEYLTSEKNVEAPIFYSVGYVPEQSKPDDTRREVRAHMCQCASALLDIIDRECFRRQRTPTSDLILSPIDERYGTDRQSKLARRRSGRLDKIHGDYLLLMGKPAEATLKYNTAMERAKATSDRLWLAGAMEGWSAAHVLLHVGTGHSLNDRSLSDRLVEHYAEIYRLYQKKRVAEPEATAALRLAEFLGIWTNRRREALEAAEHAATVGENLRTPKRAALWEALARFSERMGCRRKAAMFLYRLGLLHASQSIWPSAVALMSAAERQLSPDGRKPWPDLNRKILLAAASHAEDAGDPGSAARLYGEALSVSTLSQKDSSESDEAIVIALKKTQVPTFLPGAVDIIRLVGLNALHIQGLIVRRKQGKSSLSKLPKESTAYNGPFIYNPFEARKRAEAEAVARRSITWVCGETAHISVKLENRIGTDLVIDVMAVLMSDEMKSIAGLSPANPDSSPEPKPFIDEEVSGADHAENVKSLLRVSKSIVKTKSESVTIPTTRRHSGVVKNIEVIPKRTGVLYVTGLLIRLFDGTLVILRPFQSDNYGPQVSVIQRLPKLVLSTSSIGVESAHSLSTRAPISVFHGEKRCFRLDIKNMGPVKIGFISARVFSSHPEELQVVTHDMSSDDIKKGLENPGDDKSFQIEILSRGFIQEETIESTKDSRRDVIPQISVRVEYESEGPAMMTRESRTLVRVESQPAICLGAINVFRKHVDNEEVSDIRASQQYWFVIEVSNEVAVPVTVLVDSTSESEKRVQLKESAEESLHITSSQDCLIESGAAAQLLCSLPNWATTRIQKKCWESLESIGAEKRDGKDVVFNVKWNIPALGRQGKIPITVVDIWAAVFRVEATSQLSWHELANASRWKMQPMQAEVRIELQQGMHRSLNQDIQDFGDKRRVLSETTLCAGVYCKAKISVWNRTERKFPEASVIDIELVQLDDNTTSGKLHRAPLIGVVEGAFVGPLEPNSESFTHNVGVRLHSKGQFHLVVYVYEARADVDMHSRNASRVKPSQRSNGAEKSKVIKGTNPVITDKTSPSNNSGDLDSTSSTAKQGMLASSSEASQEKNRDSSSDLEAKGHSNQFSNPERETEIRLVQIGKEARELTPVNIIRPMTVDTYSHAPTDKRRSNLMAVSVLEFSVIRNMGRTELGRLNYDFDDLPS